MPFPKGLNLPLVRDYYTRATKGMTEPTHCCSNPTPSDGDIPMTPHAMTDTALNTQDETLTFDVSDEALEIAASAPSGQMNFTLANCTGLSACPA